MTGQAALYVLLALPLLLGIGFRVGAGHLFFSLMAGELLARYFGHDLDAAFGGAFGEAALVLAPVLATAVILRNGISRKRLVVQAVPLGFMGVICAAFVLPLLPAIIQEQAGGVPVGRLLLDLHRAIVGGMVLVQLLALWYLNRRAAA